MDIKKLIFVFIVSMIFMFSCQTPIKITDIDSIEWDAMYGKKHWGKAKTVYQTTDGGYIVGGCSKEFGFETGYSHITRMDDFYLLKLAPTGEKEWDVMYGGKGYDWLHSLAITKDGGYILVGTSRSEDIAPKLGINNAKHGFGNCYVVKVDSNGDMEWDAMYGNEGETVGYSVTQTDDGGYIIAGAILILDEENGVYNSYKWYDYYVIKLNENGEIEWQQVYGGNKNDWATSIMQLENDEYLLCGYSYSTDITPALGKNKTSENNADFYILKLSSIGEVLWDAMYGGNKNDWAFSMVKEEDGFVIVGASWSEDITPTLGNKNLWSDIYLLKVLSSGEKEWDAMYGAEGNDLPYSIIKTNDLGYLIGGKSNSNILSSKGGENKGDYDVYILKLKPNREIEWDIMYGGNSNDGIFSIDKTNDGGYIAAGYSHSSNIIPSLGENKEGEDIYLIKFR